MAHAGPGQIVVDLDGNGRESVQLAGEVSHDRDGQIVSYSWRSGGVEVSSQVNPVIELALGTWELALVVTDNDGASTQATTAVVVARASDWTITSVFDGSVSQVGMDIAVDGNGHPHVTFQNTLGNDLWYAFHDGSAWHVETVDAAGNVGMSPALALNRAGRPCIVYCEYTTGECRNLKYAWHDGANWHIESIPSVGCVDLRYIPSLCLDDADRPHIAYYTENPTALNHAWYDGSDWHVEQVAEATDGGVWGWPSLALDSSNRPHIAYRNADTGELEYVQFDGTSWRRTRVDRSAYPGQYPSMALDDADHPHIVYYNGPPSYIAGDGDLMYASYDGDNWSIEVVRSIGDVGRYPSLALDDEGRPNVSYRTSEEPRLVNFAWYDGVSWTTTTVEDGRTNLGLVWAPLSLGPDSEPHVAYWKDGALVHATMRRTPSGSSAVFRVDSAGKVFADGSFYGSQFLSGSADIAEWVPVSEHVEAGDVLVLDTALRGAYRLSQTLCSAMVAGVVSSQPGAVLGGTVSAEGMAPLALSGIVPVKVTDEGGPIQPGDLLVSSSTPGYAMRWAGPEPCPCVLVGKALEPMTDERGVISVLLTAH